MHRSGIAIASLLLVASSSPAQSPNPESLAIPTDVTSKARALADQLGSEDVKKRDAAQRQLAAMGRLARPALIAGANTDPRPEVRHRCNLLLPNATALDTRARLDTFLADKQDRYDHGLPAWQLFRSVACRERTVLGLVIWSDCALHQPARELFADFYLRPSYRRFLVALDGPRSELAEMVATRRLELNQLINQRFEEDPPAPPTLEEVALLLLGESRIGSVFAPRRGGNRGNQLLSSTGFTTAASGDDPKGKLYRSIAIAWLNSRNESREMYQSISIATGLELTDEACGLAARLMTMPGVLSTYRGRGASSLVSMGSKRHAVLVEPAFESTVVVSTVRSSVPFFGGPIETLHEIELRDLALAVAIHLAGKKPGEFGFADRYGGGADRSYDSYSYTRYYFRDDAARKSAFARWAADRDSR